MRWENAAMRHAPLKRVRVTTASPIIGRSSQTAISGARPATCPRSIPGAIPGIRTEWSAARPRRRPLKPGRVLHSPAERTNLPACYQWVSAGDYARDGTFPVLLCTIFIVDVDRYSTGMTCVTSRGCNASAGASADASASSSTVIIKPIVGPCEILEISHVWTNDLQ